jgi:hypothetical protein
MIKIVRQPDGKLPDQPIVMEEVTDPDELARARAQRERADRNSAWLQAHAHEVYSNPMNRGKVIVIAGEELFVAGTAREAMALAKAAHPDDSGAYMRYIPKENVPRIYAHFWRMAHLR